MWKPNPGNDYWAEWQFFSEETYYSFIKTSLSFDQDNGTANGQVYLRL